MSKYFVSIIRVWVMKTIMSKINFSIYGGNTPVTKTSCSQVVLMQLCHTLFTSTFILLTDWSFSL